MNFLSVEVHGDDWFFDELAVFESSGAEVDVVSVPFTEAVVGVVG